MRTGTIPGYKETRGDSVHKHHRLHNFPDHAINLAIHTRWNTLSSSDTYNQELLMCLLAWRATMPESDNASYCYNNMYYRRAEDISIKFNPLFIGQLPDGPTTGTWEISDWSKTDDKGKGSL
eukprot:2693917-Amphidinium_carterae.2